jgi:hypothetical protein
VLTLGPDASRYWLAGGGQRLARPFNLRWLLPLVCRQDLRRWWLVWRLSWVFLALGQLGLAHTAGLSPMQTVAASVALLGLPGVAGPPVTRPVGVDLPAMAIGLCGAWAITAGHPEIGLPLVAIAAAIKETSPIWVACWCWSPLPLLLLVIPAVAYLVRRPDLDPVTAQPHLRIIHDHPIRTAIAARHGQWRDARLWLEPWGPLLLALTRLDLQLGTVLLLAHLQTLVATDTVRIVQTAAGPLMAIAAVAAVPVGWAPVVVLFVVFWWRRPTSI